MKLGLDEESARLAAEYIEENYGDIMELKRENQLLQEQMEEKGGYGYQRLQREYEDLRGRYDDEVGGLRSLLEEKDRDQALERALMASGCRSNKAARALLPMDSLRMKDGRVNGLDEALEQLKQEAPFLFEEESQTKRGGYRPMDGRVRRENELKRKIYAGLRGE